MLEDEKKNPAESPEDVINLTRLSLLVSKGVIEFSTFLVFVLCLCNDGYDVWNCSKKKEECASFLIFPIVVCLFTFVIEAVFIALIALPKFKITITESPLKWIDLAVSSTMALVWTSVLITCMIFLNGLEKRVMKTAYRDQLEARMTANTTAPVIPDKPLTPAWFSATIMMIFPLSFYSSVVYHYYHLFMAKRAIRNRARKAEEKSSKMLKSKKDSSGEGARVDAGGGGGSVRENKAASIDTNVATPKVEEVEEVIEAQVEIPAEEVDGAVQK